MAISQNVMYHWHEGSEFCYGMVADCCDQLRPECETVFEYEPDGSIAVVLCQSGMGCKYVTEDEPERNNCVICYATMAHIVCYAKPDSTGTYMCERCHSTISTLRDCYNDLSAY